MRYSFADVLLDTDRFLLERGGEPVHVQPQVFDVLAHLVRNRERVVPKTELLDAVWGDRFVSESTLTSRIKAARRAVGDDGDLQRVIKTVHGRGYRWIADVEVAGGLLADDEARTVAVERSVDRGRVPVGRLQVDHREEGLDLFGAVLGHEPSAELQPGLRAGDARRVGQRRDLLVGRQVEGVEAHLHTVRCLAEDLLGTPVDGGEERVDHADDRDQHRDGRRDPERGEQGPSRRAHGEARTGLRLHRGSRFGIGRS